MDGATQQLRTRPRQKHPRFPVQARVVRYDGECAEWRSLNLSEGGMFVRGRPILDPGTVVEVGVWLPSENDNVEIVGRARVVWKNDPSAARSAPELPSGMGMEFCSLAPPDLEALREGLYHRGESPSGDEIHEAVDFVDVGTVIGSYRILDLIGSGGTGEVYLAEHVHLGRRVALKRLHDRFAGDPNAISRFFAEGRVVNRVLHANVVEIHDFISEGADTCYVMEFLEGPTLAAEQKRVGPMPLPRMLDIAAQICDAVQAVHDAGIIHRDLKPGNIVLTERDGHYSHVKLLDFGVAKVAERTGGLALGRTAPGVVVGTPGYMAPEQCLGEGLDRRCDIYALGVILYQMVTGRLVFEADSWSDMVVKHVVQMPDPPGSIVADVPSELGALILQCLEKDPEGRPSSAAEVGAQITALAERPATGKGGTSRRVGIGVAVVVIALLFGVGSTVVGLQIWPRSMMSSSKTAPLILAQSGLSPAELPARADAFGAAKPTPSVTRSRPPPAASPHRPEASTEIATTDQNVVTKTKNAGSKRRLRDRKPRNRSERRKARSDVPRLPVPVTAKALLIRARELIKSGHARQGIRVCQEVLDLDPNNGAAYQLLGRGYASLGKERVACISYERYLRLSPQAPDREQILERLGGCP